MDLHLDEAMASLGAFDGLTGQIFSANAGEIKRKFEVVELTDNGVVVSRKFSPDLQGAGG